MNLDGEGKCNISTGLKFFDHMLEQIAKHGKIDLTIQAQGDLEVDEHHTIEDTAIVLGECLYKALGSKRGIERYGYCLPMDDCLCQVALDFGGRAWLVWDATFKREKIGEMPTEMFLHFFKSLSDAAHMNLHIQAKGENEHHKIEGISKPLPEAYGLPYAATFTTTKYLPAKAVCNPRIGRLQQLSRTAIDDVGCKIGNVGFITDVDDRAADVVGYKTQAVSCKDYSIS